MNNEQLTKEVVKLMKQQEHSIAEHEKFEIVNELMYGTQEYEELMQQIQKNKKRVPYRYSFN